MELAKSQFQDVIGSQNLNSWPEYPYFCNCLPHHPNQYYSTDHKWDHKWVTWRQKCGLFCASSCLIGTGSSKLVVWCWLLNMVCQCIAQFLIRRVRQVRMLSSMFFLPSTPDMILGTLEGNSISAST